MKPLGRGGWSIARVAMPGSSENRQVGDPWRGAPGEYQGSERCWPPGGAQPYSQRGLLTEGICGGPSQGPQPVPTHREHRAMLWRPRQGGSSRDPRAGYLLVEAQAQSKAPTVLFVPMLSPQQVLVEVWQRQAGPEVGAQHVDRCQHNEGIGHRACSRAGGQSGATSARRGPRLLHPPLLKPTHLSSSDPSIVLPLVLPPSTQTSSQVAGVWTNRQSHTAYKLLVFCSQPHL